MISTFLFTSLMPTATFTQSQRGRTDLVVTNIAITPESPKPGEDITIEATILNQGQSDIDSSFYTQLVISLGPPEMVALGFGGMGGMQIGVTRIRGGLDEGEEKQVVFKWKMIQLPLVKIRVVADSPLSKIDETDKDNNEREEIIRVKSKYIDQWWLNTIKAREAWKVTKGLKDIVVAVVDSGVDYSQSELKNALWTNPGEIPGNGIDDDDNGFVDDVHGWDFVDWDNDSLKGTQIEMHGTAVAGLIAGADDGKGTTGIAPNVKIMDVRVLDATGRGKFSDVFKAMEYAVDNGADVVNLSLGAPYSEEDAEEDRKWLQRHVGSILNKAMEKNVIIVEAAGNDSQEVGWLARFDSIIAVAATTKDNEATEYSNFGPEIDVAAPGGDLSWEQLKKELATAKSLEDVLPAVNDLLITPWLREYYGWFAGTSASCPIVSATIALLRSVKPDLTLEEVREIFKKTSTDLGDEGRDDKFGYGLINVTKAVRYIIKH